MIKIRCDNCGYETGAPEKYIGKRVLCPKCKAGIEVPQAVHRGGAEQANLIKFRCPHCNQKIGLPPEYAGKNVRCAKCKNPLRVPEATPPCPPAEKGSVSGSSHKPAADDFDPFADLPDFGKLQQAKQKSPAAEMPLKLTPLDEPSKQSEFADIAGRIPATTSGPAGRREGLGGGSSGLHIDNTAVALLASVVFVILGGMVWGLIAKYAHMELGLLAWGIGALAGFGIYMFTTSRGVLLGIAAALIAFFGILSGKYFIAKWYYMPELMTELKKEDGSGFADPNKMKLSEEEIKDIMSDPGQMFGLVAMQLADDREITKEDAEYSTMTKLAKTISKASRGKYEEPNEAQKQQRELRRKEVEAKVYKCLAEWDEQKKAEVVRTQYPKMIKEFSDAFTESPIMDVVGFAVAYIAAFSLFDLLWFPIAMVTAYKFGTGEKG